MLIANSKNEIFLLKLKINHNPSLKIDGQSRLRLLKVELLINFFSTSLIITAIIRLAPLHFCERNLANHMSAIIFSLNFYNMMSWWSKGFDSDLNHANYVATIVFLKA